MTLRGRNLAFEIHGVCTKLLQSELAQGGLVVPAGELQQALFGPGRRWSI